VIETTVQRDLVRPALMSSAVACRRSLAARAGFLKVDLERNDTPALDPLTEPDDMRPVDFSCHRLEPVKVLDGWTRPVHCPPTPKRRPRRD
jgi:hypothetical protein